MESCQPPTARFVSEVGVTMAMLPRQTRPWRSEPDFPREISLEIEINGWAGTKLQVLRRKKHATSHRTGNTRFAHNNIVNTNVASRYRSRRRWPRPAKAAPQSDCRAENARPQCRTTIYFRQPSASPEILVIS
ncbi:hypothetical protein F5144DRAFT_306299 [Chaetomium tenue]|uniref:Uncharacterized protein n=1 Tax=Chaetomium tenue TaxID=1854479 RepID=A0ACB7P7U3_9PEZI|nr:hypothetical protein F5144DRAFT_306299 [Chaetomium globosum]